MSRSGTPYVKRKWVVEHTWLCSACQATNRGRDLKCTHCGKPKESSEKYDESNATSKPAVTDAKALTEATRGINWTCEYCRYENRGDLTECGKCGASRNGLTKGTEATLVTSFGSGGCQHGVSRGHCPECTLAEVLGEERRRASSRMSAFVTRVRGAQRTLVISGIAVAVVGALIWGGIWLFTPWQEQATVTSAHWSRTAVLQQRVTRDGEDWGAPPGAFNVTCERRQHGTHECHPHNCNPHSVSYDCRCHEVSAGESCHESCSSSGNGFSECEEVCTPEYENECDTCERTEYDTCYDECPTYDDWCEYQYYDWPAVRQANAGGTDADPVVWPVLAVDPNPPSPQRIVRNESYAVVFRNENDTWHYSPSDEHDFGRFHRQAAWRIEVTHAGTVKPLAEQDQVASR